MEINATGVFERQWEAMNLFELGEDGEILIDENGQKIRKYKYIIHEGSSRSSKTYSIIQSLYMFGIKNKSKRISVWRDTKKDCKDTVGYDMGQIYPYLPFAQYCRFKESKGLYHFLNTGSVIEITGTDDEKKVMGYNGDIAWLNEPYQISKGTFDQIDQRTTGQIIIDWNPKKAHWVDQLKKDKRTLVIHSTFADNIFCPREQRLKILSYQPIKMCKAVESQELTESEATIYDYIKNEKALDSKDLAELTRCQENEKKQSADNYNWSVYGLGLKAEKPNRIFRWKEISLQDFYDLEVESIYGVDWGKSDPFGIIECKYYDGGLYIRELNYDSENEIRRKLTDTERAQIDLEDEGLVIWLFKKLGIPLDRYVICDPNRKLKIIALRQCGYDDALSAHKPPGSIKDGIDLLQNLNVYYTSDSKNVKYEQENYSYKNDRYGLVLEDPMDVDNHTIDPARYVATFLQIEGVIKMA